MNLEKTDSKPYFCPFHQSHRDPQGHSEWCRASEVTSPLSFSTTALHSGKTAFADVNASASKTDFAAFCAVAVPQRCISVVQGGPWRLVPPSARAGGERGSLAAACCTGQVQPLEMVPAISGAPGD